MPEHAKVTSLEAIESFRAKLIVYRERAGRILDEVSDDVIRTRVWIEQDRPAYWKNQITLRTRDWEQRKQELFSAQLSGMRDASYIQQAAVRKALDGVRHAEAKHEIARTWSRQYDHRVEPLARQVEKLRHSLGHDIGEAVHFLTEATKTLAAYAELSSSTTMNPPVSSPDANDANAPEAAPGETKS